MPWEREIRNRTTSSSGGARNIELLRKARERTRREMLKHAADLGTSDKGALLAALLTAGLLPTVDTSGLLDAFADATHLPPPDAGQSRGGYLRR
jgi:hypothetical protein